jgi:starch phosphorylase
MSANQWVFSPESTESDRVSRLRSQYGFGSILFAGTDDAFYERHLVFDNVVDPAAAGPRERFEAIARSVRDILSQNWVRTEQTYERENPKRVYYLSMEFLIGRSLANNVTNLLLDPIAKQVINELLADDTAVQDSFRKVKPEAKSQFESWLKSLSGQTVDPDTIFGCQIKRIHEYKRQLLNALRIVILYNRLREKPDLERAPRTFFFAGKAAPAYHLAKLIIKFINNLAATIDDDPAMRDRLKVLFLSEYDVSLAERLIPASDVSNQISTAGYEASGTSNMKFMMNGALTIGTRNGATIEMAEEAGEENFFLFGLTAEQVAGTRGWYSPQWHYDNEPETRAVLDLIFSDHFSRYEPGIFAPLRDTLLTRGDHYMHLADLKAYVEADQRLRALYADPNGWARKAILNVAGSGKFSSDRTISEYANDIWRVKPCPVL